MRCRSILNTPLYTFVLLLCVFISSAKGSDLTIIPLENTSDIAVYEVIGNYDAEMPDGSNNVIPRQEIIKEFYQTHPDDYDFLVIFSNFDFQMPEDEASAFYQGVRNDVQGIGIDLIDNSSLYGSNGVLQGTIDMGNINSIVSDPLAIGFSDTLGLLSHELLHRWAAKVTFKKDDNSISSDLLGRGGYHWSFLLDTAGSLGYGNEWVDNGTGTFTALAGRRYFSPLDMYLMGLIDKSEVSPMLLIDNPEIDPERVPEPGITIEGTPQYISIDSIIAAEGERIPSVVDSQKTFRVGCILITRPDTYTEADLYGIRNIMNSWSMWFSGLTNGLGKIVIDNTSLQDLPENPGLDTPPVDPRTAPPEVNDGVAWLLNNQQEDGSWQDSLFTTARDTSTVLHSLADFSTAAEAVTKGVSWLENTNTVNLDYLARKINLLSSSGVDISGLVAELLERQNSDGGWGSNRNYLSTPADTALVLQALVTAGETSASVTDPAINYLLTEQNTDNGWGVDGHSKVQTSIDVISAFTPFTAQYQLAIPTQNGLTWLYSKQNPDGGFGNSPSTIYNTAKMLIALKQMGITSHVTDQALSYILDRQEQNGSWLSSAYQTALAINAIWITMRDPDLSVNTEEIVPSPDTIISLPSAVSLSVTAHNSGMSDVPDARVVLYEGAVSETSKIGEVSVSIPGQSSEKVVFDTTINRGSPYQYYVVVDPDNLIKESSEQNNSALRIIYPESTYDFAILQEDISMTPVVGNIFEPLAITARVKNNGTVNAFSVPLHLIVTNGTDSLTVATQTVDLRAGESVDSSFSWIPEVSGVGLSLSVLIDPHDAFVEVAEEDNRATVTIDINESTKPDLSLSYSDIVSDPAPALEAGSTSLIAKVLNRGFSPAINVQVEFYDGVPGETGNVHLGSVLIPVIAPGESADAVFDWATIPVSGERVITVVVDPENVIDEISEDNNSAFNGLQVLSLPDLEVNDSAISFSPEAPKEGDLVTVSALIRNKGEQSAANVPVAFYEGSSLIGTAIITEIEATGQATASVSFDTNGKIGITSIEVIVDPDAILLEQDRGNNRAVGSVGVQNVDLWLSDRYISPNGDGVKDGTEFGYRPTVAQSVIVAVVNEDGEVVREYSGPDFISTTSVSLTWDGLDNKGMVVDDGEYRIQVLSETESLLASLLVTVDTNRSSFLKAIGTPYIYTTKTEYLLSDYKYNWLPDDSGVIFHLETEKPERPEYETGIYTISPIGGDISRLVPEQWSENADPEIGYRYLSNSSDCNYREWHTWQCDQVNPGFAVAADGQTIAFILEKYNKATTEALQQQLWTVDRYGENLTLLDSFDYLAGDFHLITDIFPSPDGTHIAYKLYDQNADQHSFAIIRTDRAGKTTFIPGWTSGFDYQHRLTWSPDSQKIVFSNATHAIVADLSGDLQEVLPIQNPTVFFDWYGSNRILVRDTDVLYHLMDSWSVDLNALESPLLISEKLRTPRSQFGFGGCIKEGVRGILSKTPLLENGYFIAGIGEYWGPDFVNYIVCDMNGNCQNTDIMKISSYGLSLTPDAKKVVHNDFYAFVATFDRETLETEIFGYGSNWCENYLEERFSIDIPSYYTVWPTPASECPTGWAFLVTMRFHWFDNETFLAHSLKSREPEAVIAFDIEDGTQTTVVEGEDIRRLDLSPDKRYLSFLSTRNPDKGGFFEFQIVGSLLNLKAELQPSKTESAVNLHGIAADLNFFHWTLEYADQKTPEDWHILTPPAENPVVNGLFSTWIPPYEGSFLVRLTVTDKAGNTAWDRRVVTWGKKFSITNIYKTGELFSPNSDGVMDTVGLNYLVHEPVHLELFVYDEGGNLIKTFSQDHALPGEYGVIWDGKDESGGIVPDGYYTIKIFDYEFFFQVDTTPPDSQLEFSPVSCGEPSVLSASLSGLALDKNLKSWTIYYGDGDSPQEWYVFKSGDASLVRIDSSGDIILDESGKPAIDFVQGFTPQTSPPISFLSNTTYRIVVEDFAGNQSIVVAQLKEELLVLSSWDGDPSRIVLEKNEQGVCESPELLPISLLEPGIHYLTIVETLRKSIVTTTVQYRMYMQWYDAEEITDSPENDSILPFDTSSLNSEEIAAVRVKVVDETGIAYYSNSVVFNPPRFSASMGCISRGSLSPAFISMDVSLPESLETLKFQVRNTAVNNAETDDFADYFVIDVFQDLIAAPFPEDLPVGYGYPLRFVGIGESGRVYISNELEDPPVECQDCIDPEECLEQEDACESTGLAISYGIEKASCNSVNAGTAAITVSSCPEDVPQMLPDTVRYYLEEYGEWRLLKEFDYAVDGWGRILLETGGLHEGPHQVKVDLVSGESVVEGFVENTLIVDRTLPDARITYPAPSAPFCARTSVDDQGDVFRYADIEGVATDANTIQGYSIIYGQGNNPDEWVTINTASPCSPGEGNCAYLDTESKYGQLGTWDVTDVEPVEHSLQLMVTDQFGNTSCFVTQAMVDMNMSLAATTDRSIISPNGDGIKDDVTVDYQVGEYAVLDISILKDNATVRSLVSAQELTDSSGTLSWDGLDDAGATVPDGSYQIHVEARDSCGNIWQEIFPVTVDNTPPMTMISFPGTGEPLNIITEVMGTATDEHLLLYQLHVKDEASTEDPILLGESDIFVENGILGVWNTFDLEGNWALILSAEDLAGNTRTTSLPVSFGIRPQLISSLEADPNIFSPNSDGKLDTTTVTYELTDTANITIAIEDILGNTLLTVNTPNAPSGTHQYQWDGLDTNSNSVADGHYKLKVTAESITTPFVVQMEAVTLITDTTSPAIDVTKPQDSSYHSGIVDVQGALSDLNLQEYTVALSSGQDTLLLDTAVVSSEIVFSQSLDLPDGSYTLQVNAMDSVENTSIQTVSFTVDKTRPQIMLESPTEGDFCGTSQSVVSIKGIIKEVNLQSYRVQYGSGTSPSEWIDLASGEELPPDNLLATLAVGTEQMISDGDYTFRVTAIDKAGWERVMQVGIHVDNNAPDLVVTFPEEGGFVKEVFDIIGTVNDPFLKEFTLKMADSVCSPTLNWSVLRTGTQSIENDRISSIQTLPSDGVYCLGLSAVDSQDSSADIEVNFTIDTIPPAPPVLSGSLDTDTGIFLEWQGNTEPDLAGYNLYRNDEKVNTVPITETEFLDQDLVEEEYTYTVRAVDQVGWESVNSNQVLFTIDLLPPEAMIDSPRDGFQVSNYIDITGRAYSKDDFKEYRVSYGIGESPQTWQLIRTSPVPVSYGTLVRWDLVSLEDGPYTIKLEAEDLNGNVNEKLVSVIVDNTPPAMPVLLTATPDGAKVDLSWEANTEPDLAGYLVYRSGQLANESGTVVGDLSPYLITGLSFGDIGVPDGTHEYYLVAMDSAGNMSAQSNSITVSIDTHAPHLNIISPSSGLEFDKAISVKAESEDSDINTVQFQYQQSGDLLWTDFGTILTRRPYIVNLDPLSLGWNYGSYRLRAVATDQGSLSDETPEEIEVHFTDVTPPAPPTGITAQVTGETITLSWNPSQEADLAGYNVYLGTSSWKKNTEMLTDVTFIDPASFYNGIYDFKITAVDTAGNESETAPVTATVFAPILNQPPTPVSCSDITVEGSTVPGATVEIFRTLTSGTETLGTTHSDVNGLFTLAISLTEMGNNLYAVATDPDGNISRPSYTIVVTYDMPPAAPTGLVAKVNNSDITLSWDGNTELDLSGYNIYRTTTGSWWKVNPSPVAVNSYVDSELKNDTYIYRVTAVDSAGGESAPSNESSAVVDKQLPAPPSDLTAVSSPEGKAIDLCWSSSVDQVEGYLVYRSLVSDGPYVQVGTSLTQDSCYHDTGLTDGTEYFYVARAIDSSGNESINSNEASAISQDTITPEKPLILLPTVSERPYRSSSERIDITGFTEEGVTVDLIHDQIWIDTVKALSEPVHETFFLTNSLTYETVATLDGKNVYYSLMESTSYPYEYYTFRKDLETSVETRIDQIPEGSWDHMMSPDGTRMAYLYDNGVGWVRIGIYDLATGIAGPLTTAVDVDEWDHAWSRDSTKIVFDGDRGDGFWDIWVYDFTSGETSRVTENFEGFYPEISPDGRKISFLNRDPINRLLSLYLVDSSGGTPVLLDDDVDWSGDYPSVEWSPQANKLAFSANRDGFYDIYLLNIDTGETRRLTKTERTETYLQWSPDGKYISYYTYSGSETEVRTVSVDEQAEDLLLHSFEGSVASDFNWLPSGIFYRVGSDLRKIIPPGTFIFKDVGLQVGQNVFTATAEDAAGHVSQPADEIVVSINAEEMPDLEVLDQDIFVLPSVPLAGEEATFSVVIRNRSSVAAENFNAEIYIWDAQGNLELIHSETISYLDGFSGELLSINWDSTGMVGQNTVYVLLDTLNEITESLEDNNFATSSFYVAEEEGIILETSLNGKEFSSDELVAIDVDIHNNDVEKDIRLTVLVEDENGVLVEELTVLDKTLSYGGSETVELSWRAGSVFAGTYQIRTVLADSIGGVIAEEVDPFTVLPDISVSAALTTNKIEYGSDENVLFTLSVSNQGPNLILPQLKTTFTISDGSSIHHVEEQTLVNLYPKDSVSLNTFWNTARKTPGRYTASIEVFMDNKLVANDLTEFVIMPVLEISGNVSVEPKTILLGGGVKAEFTIASSGNVEAGTALLQLTVIDTKDWLVVSSHEETITLGMDEVVSGQHEFAELPRNLGVYRVMLQYSRQGESENLAGDSFTIIDGVAPVVTVLSPLDGSILSDTFELSVAAVDDAAGVADVEYQIDNGSWLPLPLVNPATGRYATRWLPDETDEGSYSVRFRATDHAGNESLPVESAIVIRPKVAMTTAIDKASYGMNENVGVSIDLVNVAWQKHVHLAIQIENQDGVVVEQVTSEDLVLAADEQKSLHYTWETGTVDAGNYTVRATVMKNDTVLTENIVGFVIEKTLVLEGSLTLSETSVPFSDPVRADWIVSNNSNFNITGLIVENNLTVQALVQLQTWTETASLQKGQTVSGSFLVQTQDMALGSYQITLQSRYESEELALANAEFEVVDITAPSITIISPADGTVVDGPIEVAASATDDVAGVDSVEYRIDQRAWQPLLQTDPTGNTYATLWTPVETDEGSRTISFRGRDKSGNVSEPVTVGVMVELCKPFEEVVGSLNISPILLYYSQDIRFEYTIANQCGKDLTGLNSRIVILDPATDDTVYEAVITSDIAPLATTVETIVVSSLELKVQQYNVLMEISQADKEPRQLTESSFEVLSAIEVENKSLDQTNLLVWFNSVQANCYDDDCDDRHDEGEEVSHDSEESDHLYSTCEDRCASYALMENVFSQATDYFMVVCNREDFEDELRNPIYTDIMIIGGRRQLTDHSNEELREKVYSGTGLISFGWNVPGDQLLEDNNGHRDHRESFLGITAKGVLSGFDSSVSLEDSPISNTGELIIDGQLLKVESADDTEVVSWATAYRCPGNKSDCTGQTETEHYPVIVLHQYGQGKSVYAAFDLCRVFNDWNSDQLTDLLINAVDFIHRSDDMSDLVPYQIRPFGLEFTSPGLDFDLQMSATCPEEIRLFDLALSDWVDEYPWMVTFPVQAGETAVLPYYVLVPDREGVFTCELDAGFADGGQYTLLQSFSYEFAVNKDRIRLLEEAIEAINTLDVTWQERSKSNNAVHYLQNVLERAGTTKKDIEKNIHDIEKAIDSLLRIESIEISSVRLQLDTLLRVEQGRFYIYE